ncbi:hypothetical protein G5C51_01410 [Streptomyces sp. A7024]|uniref:Uncharacterized protein n=1 Tax=Streptomyces coryli TaxID=1128680 RepID=A0A6G4TRZ7_9ACTN|nr:hypothetical protein [Streptomyces coryli]NGN62563.1 hypothetical protein [Streptomyces coryli]
MATKYYYWSNGRAQEFADNNSIEPERGDVRVSGGVDLKLANMQFDPRKRTSLNRAALAARIEKELGDEAETSFERPSPVGWAKGMGRVNFAHIVGTRTTDKMVLMHAQPLDPEGRRVDLCMFGSAEHLRPFKLTDPYADGHVSSDAMVIEHLLRGLGAPVDVTTGEEDLEYVGWAAVWLALNQGFRGPHHEYVDRPWLRDFALGHSEACEWMTEVNWDITRTAGRWGAAPQVGDWHRVIIGSPLWVRTANPESLVRYRRLRSRSRRWSLQCLVGLGRGHGR